MSGTGLTAKTLEKLFDRMPPHSIEMERSFLGSLLLDQEGAAIDAARTLVPSPSALFSEGHQHIYRTILDCSSAGGAVDVTMVAATIQERGLSDICGGVDYLVELAQCVPSVRHAGKYAQQVARLATLRRLIDGASDLIHACFHSGRDELLGGVKGGIERVQEIALGLAVTDARPPVVTGAELMKEELDRLELLASGKMLGGVGTGIRDLDDLLLGGLRPEYVIVGARPSVGKTAFLLHLAEWARKSNGEAGRPGACILFSAEMARQPLATRMLSMHSGVPATRLKMGRLDAQDMESVVDSAAEIGRAGLLVDDTPGISIGTLYARALRYAQRSQQQGWPPLAAVFVDYLQLLTNPDAARGGRLQEVESISRGLKALSRELKVPVVVAAQLNREVEGRRDGRPKSSDLRETGSIEQDADVVMLLHREWQHRQGDRDWRDNHPEKEKEIEIIVAKQRNGPTGDVRAAWDPARQRVGDLAPPAWGGGSSFGEGEPVGY